MRLAFALEDLVNEVTSPLGGLPQIQESLNRTNGKAEEGRICPSFPALLIGLGHAISPSSALELGCPIGSPGSQPTDLN